MKKTETKIDKAWETLFSRHNILSKIDKEGQVFISAEHINAEAECRLMTKFDHKSTLPELFEKNNLAILPVSRSNFVIGRFDAYCNINDANKAKNMAKLPGWVQGIDVNDLYSEASVLNCAYASGMIKDLLNAKECFPTVSGRMTTGSFDYLISSSGKKFPVTVCNSQCEIDGGYESEDQLLLIEAKNHLADDFNVRQLFYPYVLLQNEIKKQVVPVLLIHSNDIFKFFIYKFKNLKDYNSITLLSQTNYIMAPEEITIADIIDIWKAAEPVPEPEKCPFPQADSFDRVIDFLHVLKQNSKTSSEITDYYEFDPRQTSYYTDACKYLGLVEKQDSRFILSKSGVRIMGYPRKKKYLAIARLILSHEVFKKLLELYFHKQAPPSKDEIVSIMRECKLRSRHGGFLSESTIKRRAQSVLKWIDWILELKNIDLKPDQYI